ncbi:stealth family protein [Brevibacterium sp. 50QC2O2]|uniref:stealth family protein n=1 Tax=Brevibacterium TaxID=1696 RepID=UPI00211C0119|nr:MULTISPECIES: stealth family protein [unclassified Brevibacterium]MCQ9386009.1 stealth family protein [Brevibacterium sp. 68QC2CO]MCQ9387700.1 stealth family protein [Brevibacterium sp. 50QC2O2]
MTPRQLQLTAGAVYTAGAREGFGRAAERPGAQKSAATSSFHYDARAHVEATRAAVATALDALSIQHVQLPQVGAFVPILVIPESATYPFVRNIDAYFPADSWSIRFLNVQRRALSRRAALRRPDQIGSIRLAHRQEAANGRQMTTNQEIVSIEPWAILDNRVPRVDGETHIPGTLHRKISRPRTLVEYIVPDRWNDTVENHNGRIAWDCPHLYEVEGPVDLVYTWVDGDDPGWRAKRAAVEASVDPGSLNETATVTSRFISRNELKYSLRSVEYYASWVRTIYLVTDGQIPDWLDTSNPKIKVIDHKDIFTDADALPVFNSHAIESQLHHIPGLADKYVYMNDDIVFMRPTNPELFFTGSGQSKFFPSAAPLDIEPPSSRDLPVMSAAKRNRDYIRTNYGRIVTNKFKHTPHPQLRRELEWMEEQHPDMFTQVEHSRFRHPDDLSITSSLYHYDAYARGRAVEANIRYAYLDIAVKDRDLRLARLSQRKDLDVFCANDTNADPSVNDAITASLLHFFETVFPVKSSFEK